MTDPVSSETHITICAMLGLLFVLSVLEGILEQIYLWMPYQKLYAGTEDHIQNEQEETKKQEPNIIKIIRILGGKGAGLKKILKTSPLIFKILIK